MFIGILAAVLVSALLGDFKQLFQDSTEIVGVLIAVAIGLVIQGVAYVGAGVGGLVPYLIILGGPALAAYYTWYFNFYRFEGPKSPS